MAKPKQTMAPESRPSAEPSKAKAAGKSTVKSAAPQKTATRAATALRIAQNLEKSGRADPALKSYRQVVKDYPGSPQAKTAAERIKILEKK